MKQWDEYLKKAAPPKAQRIRFLQSLGLNTPVYEEVNWDNKDDLAAKYADGASIRCDNSASAEPPAPWTIAWGIEVYPKPVNREDWKMPAIRLPPHFPSISGREIEPALRELISCGWKPVITEAITAEDNLMSGCIITIKGQPWHYYDFMLEAVIGTPNRPVMARDVAHGGAPDIRLRLPAAIQDLHGGAFYEIYQQIKNLRVIQIVLEFGYCRRPVGRLKTKALFWDGYIL